MSSAAADYLSLFRARRAACAAALELSQQQSTAIDADAYSELLELLHNKQRLLDDLLDHAGDGDSRWQSWPKQRELLQPAERAECEAVLADLERLLALLLREEQRSTQALAARCRTVQTELAAANQGVRVHEAYGVSTAAASSARLIVDG